MEIVVTGSGGCQITPRPCCNCEVCLEARLKGRPYSRNGPSLWVDGVLFDTPEEISVELNESNIPLVDAIFYTHADPDHVNGLRVVEQINWDWEKRGPRKSLKCLAPEGVYGDLRSYSTHMGKFMDYYEKRGMAEYLELPWGKAYSINGLEITPVRAAGRNVAAYAIESGGKKVVYAPCDCKPFPSAELLKNADLLVISSPFYEAKRAVPENDPARQELFSESELEELVERVSPAKTVVTHLEEVWQLSYDDYRAMETDRLKFAHDGMRIVI